MAPLVKITLIVIVHCTWLRAAAGLAWVLPICQVCIPTPMCTRQLPGRVSRGDQGPGDQWPHTTRTDYKPYRRKVKATKHNHEFYKLWNVQWGFGGVNWGPIFSLSNLGSQPSYFLLDFRFEPTRVITQFYIFFSLPILIRNCSALGRGLLGWPPQQIYWNFRIWKL